MAKFELEFPDGRIFEIETPTDKPPTEQEINQYIEIINNPELAQQETAPVEAQPEEKKIEISPDLKFEQPEQPKEKEEPPQKTEKTKPIVSQFIDPGFGPVDINIPQELEPEESASRDALLTVATSVKAGSEEAVRKPLVDIAKFLGGGGFAKEVDDIVSGKRFGFDVSTDKQEKEALSLVREQGPLSAFAVEASRTVGAIAGIKGQLSGGAVGGLLGTLGKLPKLNTIKEIGQAVSKNSKFFSFLGRSGKSAMELGTFTAISELGKIAKSKTPFEDTKHAIEGGAKIGVMFETIKTALPSNTVVGFAARALGINLWDMFQERLESGALSKEAFVDTVNSFVELAEDLARYKGLSKQKQAEVSDQLSRVLMNAGFVIKGNGLKKLTRWQRRKLAKAIDKIEEKFAAEKKKFDQIQDKEKFEADIDLLKELKDTRSEIEKIEGLLKEEGKKRLVKKEKKASTKRERRKKKLERQREKPKVKKETTTEPEVKVEPTVKEKKKEQAPEEIKPAKEEKETPSPKDKEEKDEKIFESTKAKRREFFDRIGLEIDSPDSIGLEKVHHNAITRKFHTDKEVKRIVDQVRNKGIATDAETMGLRIHMDNLELESKRLEDKVADNKLSDWDRIDAEAERVRIENELVDVNNAIGEIQTNAARILVRAKGVKRERYDIGTLRIRARQAKGAKGGLNDLTQKEETTIRKVSEKYEKKQKEIAETLEIKRNEEVKAILKKEVSKREASPESIKEKAERLIEIMKGCR